MSDFPKLIGLCGYAGAGKDLVAALLKMVGYHRIGFADAVRKEIATQREIPLMPQHILEDYIEASKVKNWLYAKPMSLQARRVLQWWGTEFRRSQDPDYWIKRVETTILDLWKGSNAFYCNAFKYANAIVISDVRFLNEANWIKGWDGIIWRIERPGLKSDGHISESQSEFIKADYTISNDGDLQHLASQVCTALEVFRSGDYEPQKATSN